MRSECSGTDAKQVIEIMKASMVDCHENELSTLESSFSQSQTIQGKSKSKSSQMKNFIAILVRVADSEGRKLFNMNELKRLITVILRFFKFNMINF